MSRKKRTSSEPSSFGKLLGWTVVLALVFSAGLITGQRLLRRQAMPPLVSLQTTQPAEEGEAIETGEERLPTTFSFYEHLGEEPKSAKKEPKKVEKPASEQGEIEKGAEKEVEKPVEKPAEKPKPESNKPEPAAAAEPKKENAEAAAPDSQNAAEKVIKQVADVLADEPEAKKLPARYTLQVGSHTDRHSADQQISKLESMGLEPHVVMVEVPERGRFFRVRIGKFHSMEEARNFQGAIQTNRGVSSFVSPI